MILLKMVDRQVASNENVILFKTLIKLKSVSADFNFIGVLNICKIHKVVG